MESFWKKTALPIKFDTLTKSIKTDVLIIGGGMAGLLCAHALHEEGIDYALLEADRICNGITKNTTAKITAQHGLIYSDIIKRYSSGMAKLYLNANLSAKDKYEKLCRNIDCDFLAKDSYVFSLNNEEKIKDELYALRRIGYHASFETSTELPFKVAGAIKFENQAQFHPLKFAYHIAKGLNIYENTKVIEIRPDYVSISGGKVKADKIIVATHFPFINKYGGYFFKQYQHRSYVLALKNAKIPHGMYVDEDLKGLSFRSAGEGILLLGGASHRTGKRGGAWDELECFAKRYYPSAEIVGRFATQDCMTLDGIPYIGRYSKRTPNLYVATGFNKWGMTSSMVASELLTDLIKGKTNPLEKVFDPSRSILHPQLALNAAESVINLLTPTAPRCPHLGCALKYNVYEHSWDCPCHGSRFTEEGKLIDNPATSDKNKTP